jgi:hypothetical protein
MAASTRMSVFKAQGSMHRVFVHGDEAVVDERVGPHRLSRKPIGAAPAVAVFSSPSDVGTRGEAGGQLPPRDRATATV